MARIETMQVIFSVPVSFTMIQKAAMLGNFFPNFTDCLLQPCSLHIPASAFDVDSKLEAKGQSRKSSV